MDLDSQREIILLDLLMFSLIIWTMKEIDSEVPITGKLSNQICLHKEKKNISTFQDRQYRRYINFFGRFVPTHLLTLSFCDAVGRSS